MSTWLWLDIVGLTVWMLLLHLGIARLRRIAVVHIAIIEALVSGRGDVLAEEVAKARADLGEAVERLDVGRLRERVDPQERRAD